MGVDPDEVWRSLGGRPPPRRIDRRSWPIAYVLFAVLIVPTLFVGVAYVFGRLMKDFG